MKSSSTSSSSPSSSPHSLLSSPPSSALSLLNSHLSACIDPDVRAPAPKRVVVVGGGLSGLSTGYWLGRAGNKVTVIEKEKKDGLGSTPSYSGLLAPSSSMAPFFARPHYFRAQKVQFCPFNDYMHANLRVGLFDSLIPHSIRRGIQRHSFRRTYLDSVTKLHGLALANMFMVDKIQNEWMKQGEGSTASTSKGGWMGWGKRSSGSDNDSDSDSGAAGQNDVSSSGGMGRVRGTLMIGFDDHTFQELKTDITNHIAVNRIDAQQALSEGETASSSNSITAASSSSAASSTSSLSSSPSRVSFISDDECVSLLPSLASKRFDLSGGVLCADEFALDPTAFMKRLRRDAKEKYGVEFKHETEVKNLVTADNVNALANSSHASSTAVVPSTASPPSSIVGVQTSAGFVPADSVVLCAGSNSSTIVAQSGLNALIKAPIETFQTKTHYLSFPYEVTKEIPATNDSNTPLTPAAPSSSSDSSHPSALIPLNIVLPESHLTLTPLHHEIRLTIGDDMYAQPPANSPDATAAAASKDSASTVSTSSPSRSKLRAEPAKLQLLLSELRSVYPQLTKEAVSQQGRTIPHVALRTWTMDNKPLLGQYHSSIPNLFINGAHGNQGWSSSLASGKQVSDIVSGIQPFMRQEIFDPRRFEQQK